MLVRAVLAFLALPGVVAFVIPLLLARVDRGRMLHPIALVPLLLGIALLLWCVREFYVRGKGTLAPWDPPRHLVASGPYRVSRNPMYVAVATILFGWAVAFASRAHLWYALVVAVAFHLRVVLAEEPFLVRTHAEEWTLYKARVPRWIFRNRRQVAWAWLAAIVFAMLAGLAYTTLAARLSTG